MQEAEVHNGGVRNKLEVMNAECKLLSCWCGNVFEDEWRWGRALSFVIPLSGGDLSVSCFRMREM